MLDHVMEQADLVVIPSYSETFCITALAAMIRRRPVILSRIPALQELYQDVCIFVEPQNHASLEKGIEGFLKMGQDQIEDLVNNAYEHVRANYLWNHIAHETLFKYLAILPYADGRWHICGDTSLDTDQAQEEHDKSQVDSEEVAPEMPIISDETSSE